jgi:hypothetical protein
MRQSFKLNQDFPDPQDLQDLQDLRDHKDPEDSPERKEIPIFPFFVRETRGKNFVKRANTLKIRRDVCCSSLEKSDIAIDTF